MKEKEKEEMQKSLEESGDRAVEDEEREAAGVPPKNPSVEWKLWQRVESGDILVDLNGHFEGSIGAVKVTEKEQSLLGIFRGDERSWLHMLLFEDFRMWMGLKYEGLHDDGPLVEDVQMVDDWLEGKETEDYSISTDGSHPCWECGKRFTIKFNGKRFLFRGECSEAGGLKDLKVTMAVPSGTLVFANDFRGMLRDTEEVEDRNINLHIESMRLSQDYVKHGMFYSFVGNSCPSIFLKDGVITVGNNGHTEDYGEGVVLIEGAETIGSICTDLWWFSAMDKEDFTKRCLEFNAELKEPLSDLETQERMDDLIECEVSLGSGTYEMTIMAKFAVDGDNMNGERFAEIRRTCDNEGNLKEQDNG